MGVKLALELLYEDVTASYTAEGLAVTHSFGWREPGRQADPARINWVPGDGGSTAGRVTGAVKPGRNPRPLLTFHEFFQVYITGRDDTAPEDELAQWKATRLLLDDWLRHVYKAAFGRFTIQSMSWRTTQKERRFGATLVVVASIQSMVPDSVQTETGTDTQADIDITQLSQTETILLDKDGYV